MIASIQRASTAPASQSTPPLERAELPLPATAARPTGRRQRSYAPSEALQQPAAQNLSAPAEIIPKALTALPPEGRWGRAAHTISNAMGTPYAFFGVSSSVVIWVAIGAPMQWNNTWLILGSTVASILAGVMVFVVQTSQNRDQRQNAHQLQALEARAERLQNDVTELKTLLGDLLQARKP